MSIKRRSSLVKPEELVLSVNPVTVPNDYFGMHANRWPISQNNEKQASNASGVQGNYYITLSSTLSELFIGNVAVTQGKKGTAVGAKITGISGTRIDLDLPNEATFSNSVIEFFGPIVANGSVSTPSPALLNYDIFRTLDSSWGLWGTQNPAPGVYDWQNTDAIYNQIVVNEGREMLVTLYGTPQWASARPYETGYSYGRTGFGAEPYNMQHWADYIDALITRYPLLKYFEVWNEPSFTYIKKSATGTSGQFTIVVADNTGLANGKCVMGTGIARGAKIQSFSGTAPTITVTLDIQNTGTVSGDVTFHTTGTHNWSGTEEKLAEMTRIACQVIKAKRPDAKISLPPFSNIQQSATPLREIGAISTDGTSITILSVSNNQSVGTKLKIIGTENYNTPPGTWDVVATTSTNSFTIARAVAASTPTERAGRYTSNWSGLANLILASTQGLSVGGNDGSGTTIGDWVDIFATHTYQPTWWPTIRGYGNDIFSQVSLLKESFSLLGFPVNIEMWATEFCHYFVSPLTGTSCSIGDKAISISMGSSEPGVNLLRNQTLKDPSGNVVGKINGNWPTSGSLAYSVTSNVATVTESAHTKIVGATVIVGTVTSGGLPTGKYTITSTTSTTYSFSAVTADTSGNLTISSCISIADGALVALTGTSRLFTDAEIVASTCRYILTMAAAGFKRAFYYTWDHGLSGINDNPTVYNQIANIINSAKGKTIVKVTEKTRYGVCKFWFSDGSIIEV